MYTNWGAFPRATPKSPSNQHSRARLLTEHPSRGRPSMAALSLVPLLAPMRAAPLSSKSNTTPLRVKRYVTFRLVLVLKAILVVESFSRFKCQLFARRPTSVAPLAGIMIRTLRAALRRMERCRLKDMVMDSSIRTLPQKATRMR